MKITIFTSNQKRHNYLINVLSKISSELYVIQECQTIHTGIKSGQYKQTSLIKNYFSKVKMAEKKFFKDRSLIFNKKTNFISLKFGDLNLLKINEIKNFLNSEFYIVFGSSYIKGHLSKFLVKKKAINIHMGISPYYRGTDCNFWALYDNNPEYVGATIHHITSGIDDGPILYHALSEYTPNPFNYSMSTVKSAIDSLAELIKTKKIYKLKPKKFKKISEIRYSNKKNFSDNSIKIYNKKIKNFKKFNFNLENYYNPIIVNH